jgi:hypothetical protein
MYAQHIHSICFRLIGEAFGMLPTLEKVTLSGYSQRKDKATGHERDEYLLSVTVSRLNWSKLNFGDLQSVDPIHAMSLFDLRRTMSKTGVFTAVEPF